MGADCSGLSVRSGEASSRILFSVLTSLMEDPPSLPGWTPAYWRAALRRAHAVENLSRMLSDIRLQPLLNWVASRTTPHRQLGALAAVLAVLDGGIREDNVDASALARRIEIAAITAGYLGPRPMRQARVTPSPSVERYAAPSACSIAVDESPFLRIASTLLEIAGGNSEAVHMLSVRLGAALDVAIDQWMRGAQQGAGLPPFPSEHRLRSTHRLVVRLGRDRDLLHLVFGPQPGRGRDLQAARRRGLAYWVAVTWRAERLAEAPPTIPGAVVAHWRKELRRLGVPLSPAPAADSWDAPSA
jgi:hypothetical protein